MEGGAAAAAMEVLVQHLINISKEEISLIRGLDKESEQLKTSLEMIQSYLNDTETKYITQGAVKAWLNKLEEVAFDADNVLDELNYHALHKKVKAVKTMVDKALSCFSSFYHTVRPYRMAHRIKQINTSLDSINKRATDLQLQRILVDAPAAVPDASFETDCFTVDPVFIGRDDDVPKLVEVMMNCTEEQMFTIVAVVGMGGIGKTTLTRKLFHHQKIKNQFVNRIWVHVSQTFDPFIIFKKILVSLSSNTVEAESRQANMKNLEDALKAKTYLFVLDDIWNEDVSKWTDFIESLSGVTSTKGNGIIITTRSARVASVVNPLETHLLKGLSVEDCWSIIKAKAFEMGNVIPSEFEITGRKIAKKCQGLPLAAKVVGGVLRCKSEQEWLSIEQKWLSDGEGDNISRILRLSYDNLSSSSLKKCFAYCSIFPKGGRMGKQELIELWMAEGFLQLDGRNDMESLGEKFVNVLLHNSLLQLVPRNGEDEDKEICVMHDLVHDVGSSVLSSLKVRYMRHDDESIHILKKNAKHLRTLFIEGNISEFKLSNFKYLHVLNIGSHLVKELQSSEIGKLIHLRKLNVSKTKIEYLPDSIGELHHLQTLRANTKSLKELPRKMKYLISLRHLYIQDDVKLPPKIGRLTSLQTLSHFTVGKESGCKIEELGCLKNLKGKLKILNLEMVQGKAEAEKANIAHNPNILELKFEWGRNSGDEINDQNVLEGLQPHPNLKKLEIYGFKGNRFPLWTLKMAVRDEPQGCWVGLYRLVEIRLSECDECEEIPMLGHLPNLKNLSLSGLRKVKSIDSSFYGIQNIRVGEETIIVFPLLESLKLSSMDNLREWAEVEFHENRMHEVKVFPRLEHLGISNCPELKSAPRHFLTCLKILVINGMDNYKSLAKICGVALMSLTYLDLDTLSSLECLPDWFFHNNQNLKKLSISRCSKLRELPDGLHTLNSLEELRIRNCPNLKSIGNSSGSRGESQGTLRELLVVHCKELVDLPHEMVESWAPSLDKVWLDNLSSLKNLPKVIECLTKSARLRELSVVGVPNFMVTKSVKSWPFRSMCYLTIDVSVERSRESSVSIKETVDCMLQGCSHSLVYLELKGLEIWECLPKSIQNLAGLYELELHNLGIEELPEWLGNLSSLHYLTLKRCKKLRSVHALGRLPKLEYLWFDECPELCIEIPHHQLDVYVDGRRITNVCPLHMK